MEEHKEIDLTRKDYLGAMQTICEIGYLSKDEMRLWLWVFARGGLVTNTWQREMAREMRMHRASLNRAIKRLNELGLIRRQDVSEEVSIMYDFGIERKIKRIWIALTIDIEGTIVHAQNLVDNYYHLQDKYIHTRIGTPEELQERFDQKNNAKSHRDLWNNYCVNNPNFIDKFNQIRIKKIDGVWIEEIDTLELSFPKEFPPALQDIARIVWLSDHVKEIWENRAHELREDFAINGYWFDFRRSLGLKSGITPDFERQPIIFQPKTSKKKPQK